MKFNGIPLSILDLAFVREGESFDQAIKDSVSFAQKAESLGFNRFWVAEHHNASGIASSATAVLMGHLAEKTEKIRIGSGGIMLPNHSPLQVAEAFGTLATMYPGRIDLGVGRAPGTDKLTSAALRRDLKGSVEQYPSNIMELMDYLDDPDPERKVNAFPGVGTKVPVWILGSSLYSAQLAAYLGLPYSFASHFAPQYLFQALDIYRKEFRPSVWLEQPYAMPAVNIIIAETDEKAEYLGTTAMQMAVNIVQQKSARLQPPVKNMDKIWSPQLKFAVESMRAYSFTGNPDKVIGQLKKFISDTGADEIIFTSYFYDIKDRDRSLELLAGIGDF